MLLGLKDNSSISIGPATVRIGGSESNLSFTLPVLTDTDYMGYSEQTNIVYSVDYKERTAVNSHYPTDMKTDRQTCAIEMKTVELSKDIFSLMFGIYPNIFNNSFSFGILTDIDFRVEIEYTYPDNVKKLFMIFPKVRIMKGLNIALSSDAEVVSSIKMNALAPGTTTWENNPLGTIYLQNFEA